VAASAVVAGEVEIAAGTAVMDGAVIVAESAPVRIGAECVIMEHAVIRGAGRNPAIIADRVLVGPHAHVTGARIDEDCLIATGATVFSGSRVRAGSVVAIGAIVHVATVVPADSQVPMQNIAVGDPMIIYPPDRAREAHLAVKELGFTSNVFGESTSHLTMRETNAWICRTYSAALRRNAPEGHSPEPSWPLTGSTDGK
jgi:carbonic anhydrase/acetyltransferase-like protein (isoleucine patch superfamily)